MCGHYASVFGSWDGGEYGFMIDGMVFSGNELSLMMSAYEGSSIFIQAGSGDFRTGEYLVPVVLTEKELIRETIELMNMFTVNGRFERSKDRENFEKLFEKNVLTKLKLYHRSRPGGYGRLAGMKIIRRLKWIEETEKLQEAVRRVLR